MQRVVTKFSYVLISNIINAFSKFLILIIIIKILNEYELGVYTFALAITAPITLLFNMKLRSYIISSDNIDYVKFTQFRNFTNVIAMLIIFLISVLFYRDISIIILLIAIIKIIEMNFEYYQSYPNREKFFERPSILMIWRVLTSTLIFYITLLITEKLAYALVFQIFSLVIYLFIEKKENLSLVNITSIVADIRLKSLFFTLIPLGIVQALFSFSTNIPKYLLEQLGNIEQVGIFSGILYVVTIFNLLMTTLNQTLLPYLKDIFRSNVKKYNLILNIYLNSFSILIGIIFIIFSYYLGDYILKILFSNAFADHSYLLIIFGFIIMLNMSGWAYDSSLLLAGAIKLQPYLLVVISLITMIVGSFFIKEYGLLGAGLTLLIFNILNTISKALYYNIYIKKAV